MSYWTFYEPHGFFELTLPDNWAEYEDEPNTFAFFDTSRWTGNFRITHYRYRNGTDEDINSAEDFIAGQLRSNEGAVRVKLGALDCAHYVEPLADDDDGPLVMYCWMGVCPANRFACSFTAPLEGQLSIERSATPKDRGRHHFQHCRPSPIAKKN